MTLVCHVVFSLFYTTLLFRFQSLIFQTLMILIVCLSRFLVMSVLLASKINLNLSLVSFSVQSFFQSAFTIPLSVNLFFLFNLLFEVLFTTDRFYTRSLMATQFSICASLSNWNLLSPLSFLIFSRSSSKSLSILIFQEYLCVPMSHHLPLPPCLYPQWHALYSPWTIHDDIEHK